MFYYDSRKKNRNGEVDMEQKQINEKKVSVANFNIVFMKNGSEEYPLLDYFDLVLMPALNSGIERQQGNNTFLLMNVEVKKDANDEYVLTGLIVKSTVLERKSMFDENGVLIERDDVYPTAPFSTFIIYLKNHRMILVENQKGSPALDSFRSTVKYIIDTYVARENHIREEQKQEELPIPLISIVGIAPKGGMASELKKVEKVSTLTLKFYPLNGDGDIDFSGVMNGVTNELRRRLGCDRGAIVYRSPKNISGIIEVVEASEGTVEPVIVAKYPGKKGDVTIRTDEVKERRKMFLPEGDRQEELQNMMQLGKQIDSIIYTSEENTKIYERNQGKIELYMKK